ncbi:hypothetical protein ES703_59356 [subsurface metagenome]
MHGIVTAPPANDIGCFSHPLGQNFTEALSIGSLPDELEDDLSIAPFNVEVINVTLPENTFLVALHSPGDGLGGKVNVQTQLVAVCVRLDCESRVIYSQLAVEVSQCFKLEALSFVTGIGAFVYPPETTAGDTAGGVTHIPHLVFGVKLLLVKAFKHIIRNGKKLEVLIRNAAYLLFGAYADSRPKLPI